MKTLDEIKGEVAHKNYCNPWYDLSDYGKSYCNDEIIELYAKEVATQALIDASERATAFMDHNDNPIVHKKSIIETPIKFK